MSRHPIGFAITTMPRALVIEMLANDDDLPQRIVEKIEGEALDDCWEWTAASDTDGYGRVWIEGALRTAHRAVFELLVGPVPDGMELDHLCRNPACVKRVSLERVYRVACMVSGVDGPIAPDVKRMEAFRKAGWLRGTKR